MENKTLFEQAKSAKSAKELFDIAKTAGVEMSEEHAEHLFAQFNRSGELADEELDSVAGGGCKTEETSPYVGRRFRFKSNKAIGLGICRHCGSEIFVVTQDFTNSYFFAGHESEKGLRGECAQCGENGLLCAIDEVEFM